SRNPHPAGKLVTTPRNHAVYIPDQDDEQQVTLINEGFPVYRPSMDIAYTWFEVPYDAIPFETINYTLGCVNAAVFDPLYGAYGPGTAMLYSCELKKCDLASGERGADVVYRVLVSPGWDYGQAPAEVEVEPGRDPSGGVRFANDPTAPGAAVVMPVGRRD